MDEKWFVCARRHDPSAGLKREKRFGERLIGKRRALEASKKTYRGWRSGRICVCSKVMILLFAPPITAPGSTALCTGSSGTRGSRTARRVGHVAQITGWGRRAAAAAAFLEG